MAAIFTLKGPAQARARNQEPTRTQFRTCAAVGPNEYTVEQPFLFDAAWGAYISAANEFVLQPPNGAAEFNSTLYDSPAEDIPNHIALGFDPVSRHVIAWERDGVIRVGWEAGGPQHLSFAGLSPVIFSTWSIDGTITGGESTTAVLYVKKGDPNIYGRAIVESFGQERTWANKAVHALYLQEVIITDRIYMDLVGMDASHRLVTWRSEAYIPPPLEQVVNVGADQEITGEYWQIPFTVIDETALVGALAAITGTYRELRVLEPAEDEGARVGALAAITGTYRELRVLEPAEDEGARVGVTGVDMDYYLAAIFEEGEPANVQVGVDPEISGSYSSA